MGGPISVAMAGIFMSKMEKDIIKPPYPIFYKRYVDDVYFRRKRNNEDKLFNDLNNYHENIKFTLEKNPKKFLDTKIAFEDNNIITEVVSNDRKLPPHWSSKIPKRYKRNIINGELHRAKKISSNFDKEIIRIRDKYIKAGYPLRFINSVISSFNNKNTQQRNSNNDNEDLNNDPNVQKSRIIINLPFCYKNEEYSKTFLSKLKSFTNNKYSFLIVWKTRKIRSLFPLKDKVNISHCSNVIYEGVCTCDNNYIGITDRNSSLRFEEHNNPNNKSEPAKHLKSNDGHTFTWRILSKSSKNNTHKGKILEAFFIKANRPTLNNQTDNYQLKLFHNGIT